MGIIKGFVKKIEDPNAPGETVTIRMLSHFELQAAADAALEQMRARVKSLSEMRGAIASVPAADVEEARARVDAEKKKAAEDPLMGLDVLTLLKLGVVEWTYRDGNGEKVQLDVELFDEASAPFFAREIARYSRPTDAELSKASSSSIAT